MTWLHATIWDMLRWKKLGFSTLIHYFIKILKLEFLVTSLIAAPAFIRLFTSGYFSMHDDQHIVRLYLLDQGIRQGSLYPRWVDGLGFGFGYPLYNFYPPLIYYVSNFFHWIGLSYITSIKAMLIVGFLLAAYGSFVLAKQLTNRPAAYVASCLYTFFFYHSVTVYVRGAFAEFFTFGILPFVFHSLLLLSKKLSLKHTLYFGISIAALILTHPLIALPAVLFVGAFGLFLILAAQKNKLQLLKSTALGGLVGLALSCFFWLPSLVEKSYTLVDEILTRELASYTRHFIYPSQFWYSPWGYGGSVPGSADGLTFQLGKIHLFLVLLSVVLFLITVKKKELFNRSAYIFVATLLGLSVFLTTTFSATVWAMITPLWYIQFPWRFLTFVALFISLVGSWSIYFLSSYLKPQLINLMSLAVIVGTIFIYQKYFQPQSFYVTTDEERTSSEEVAWRISGTSYEFVPKGVETKIADDHTVLNIDKSEVTDASYQVLSGVAEVVPTKTIFTTYQYQINAQTPLVFQLNTYLFPGWKGYITAAGETTPLVFENNNRLKLITTKLPSGKSEVTFRFEDTPIRRMANMISITAVGLIVVLTGKSNLTSKKKKAA